MYLSHVVAPCRNRYHLSFNRLPDNTLTNNAQDKQTSDKKNYRMTKKKHAWSLDMIRFFFFFLAIIFFLSLSFPPFLLLLFFLFFFFFLFSFPCTVLIGPSSDAGHSTYRLAGTCLGEHNKQHMPLK